MRQWHKGDKVVDIETYIHLTSDARWLVATCAKKCNGAPRLYLAPMREGGWKLGTLADMDPEEVFIFASRQNAVKQAADRYDLAWTETLYGPETVVFDGELREGLRG